MANKKIFLFGISIGFSLKTADLNHAWAAGTGVLVSLSHPDFLSNHTGQLISFLPTHLHQSFGNQWIILIIFDRNRFQKLLDSNRQSGDYMAWPHQVMSILLVPQEQRYWIWLAQQVRSNDKLINCWYSTQLKNREEIDGGKTEDAVVWARVGNVRTKDEAQGTVVWPDKSMPWEISLHSFAVHKIN